MKFDKNKPIILDIVFHNAKLDPFSQMPMFFHLKTHFYETDSAWSPSARKLFFKDLVLTSQGNRGKENQELSLYAIELEYSQVYSAGIPEIEAMCRTLKYFSNHTKRISDREGGIMQNFSPDGGYCEMLSRITRNLEIKKFSFFIDGINKAFLETTDRSIGFSILRKKTDLFVKQGGLISASDFIGIDNPIQIR